MLTQEQIAFYREHGYLGVENVLSDDEVNDLRRITDEFVEKSREVTEHTAVFDLEPGHTPENPKLRRLKSPILLHEVYRKTLHHEKNFGNRIAIDRIRPAVQWQQTEHEATRIRQPGRMASRLGILST